MDRCPPTRDRGQESCQQSQWHQPDWAREYAASYQAGGRYNSTIIESNVQVVRPDQQIVTGGCWGRGGYQDQGYRQDQGQYREYFVRCYPGQQGYYQGGYQGGYDQYQQYQQYYWQQYQQYYWQQYQQYYAQQYQNYYQRGPQGNGYRRGGCGCGCGGGRCGGNSVYSYRTEQYGGGYQERYTQRYTERYEDDRYYESRRYGYDNRGRGGYERYGTPMCPQLKATVDSMVGQSIRRYDRSVPETLGCARFVSSALEQAYGLPIRDASVRGLERSLQKQGFVAVPFEQAQPGDVIIGHRSAGDHGHAAIYYGDGQIVNNSTTQRRIAIQSVDKFYASDFRKVVAYRRVG